MRSTDSARMGDENRAARLHMDNRCLMCGCDTSKPRPNRKPSEVWGG